MIMVLFLAKNSRTIIYVPAGALSLVLNPWLIFPQFCAFLRNCFAQSSHNFNVVLCIVQKTLWQKFIMHHDIAFVENSEKNLHIWLNLTCFFRSQHFWTLPLGWLDFDFNVKAIQTWLVTSYELFFGKSRLSLNEHLLRDVHATFNDDVDLLIKVFAQTVSILE